MNKILKIVCAAVVMSGFALLCGLVVAPSWAQDPGPSAPQPGGQNDPASLRQQPNPKKAGSDGPLGLIMLLHQPYQQRIQTEMKTLREAKTDADKQAAKSSLRKTLAAIFSEDMQERAQQAKEIESRLAKLRQQYEKRENLKDEIIELQLKVLEKAAEGLEFPLGGPGSGTPKYPGVRNIPASAPPQK